MREAILAFAQVIATFVIVTYFSTPKKALVTSTVIWSIRVAISARRDGWQKPRCWWIVAFVGIVNAVAIWIIPINDRFKASLANAYPIGLAEGFGVYWLLGWWLRRRSGVRE